MKHPLRGVLSSEVNVWTIPMATYLVHHWQEDIKPLMTIGDCLVAMQVRNPYNYNQNSKAALAQFTPSPDMHPCYCDLCLAPVGYVQGGGLARCQDHWQATFLAPSRHLFHPMLHCSIRVASYYLAHAQTFKLTGGY